MSNSKIISLLNKNIYPEGGILLESLSEFKIVTTDDLSVRIKPGMAILPNGELLVLNKEIILNLSPYSQSTNLLIVSIDNMIKGSHATSCCSPNSQMRLLVSMGDTGLR